MPFALAILGVPIGWGNKGRRCWRNDLQRKNKASYTHPGAKLQCIKHEALHHAIVQFISCINILPLPPIILTIFAQLLMETQRGYHVILGPTPTQSPHGIDCENRTFWGLVPSFHGPGTTSGTEDQGAMVVATTRHGLVYAPTH